jgi:hypothetical protein
MSKGGSFHYGGHSATAYRQVAHIGIKYTPDRVRAGTDHEIGI